MTVDANNPQSPDCASVPAPHEGQGVSRIHAGRDEGVVETPEQSWAAFCSGLDQPAFLLAITGFGDLEQS